MDHRRLRFIFVVVLACAASIGLVPDSAWAWGTCQCYGQDMDRAGVPTEGLLELPSDTCANPSLSLWVTDADGVSVSGSIDTSVDAETGAVGTFWRADAPLTAGATYKYYHVVKDSTLGFNSTGCETTATLTARDGAFPAMEKPTVVMEELQGIWFYQYGCFMPRVMVTVNKHSDAALVPYQRYELSLLRGDEVIRLTWAPGAGSETLINLADWAGGQVGEAPFDDEYCVRVDAWEVVNGTAVSEDVCVPLEELIGAPASGSGVEYGSAVPEDAVFCDSSIDITAPLPPPGPPPTPPTPPDVEVEVDGCSQGRSSDALPGLLWILLLALGSRRFRRREA